MNEALDSQCVEAQSVPDECTFFLPLRAEMLITDGHWVVRTFIPPNPQVTLAV